MQQPYRYPKRLAGAALEMHSEEEEGGFSGRVGFRIDLMAGRRLMGGGYESIHTSTWRQQVVYQFPATVGFYPIGRGRSDA